VRFFETFETAKAFSLACIQQQANNPANSLVGASKKKRGGGGASASASASAGASASAAGGK
jgi:hypothetical protein